MLDKTNPKHLQVDIDGANLSLTELAALKDVPATKPVPPLEQPIEYRFEADGGASVDVERVTDHRTQRSQLIVKSRSMLREVGPVAQGDDISLAELGGLPTTQSTSGMRPEWLDLVYFPKTLPAHDRFSNSSQLRPRASEQLSREWPWNTIGKMIIRRASVPDKRWDGSGVMVGPNLMMTASHGMPWGTNDATIEFHPAYRAGSDPRFDKAFVTQWRGVRVDPDDANGLDYVICRLDRRMGDRTGWMGSYQSTNDDFYKNRRWTSVGYPEVFFDGNRPAVEFNLAVDDVDNEGSDGRELETRTYANKGWSGGPLWGWFDGDARVVGIMSGAEKDGFDPKRDVHAGGRKLVDLINYGRTNWA